MKILQINNVYDFGSTGKITADIHHALQKQGVESVVCYSRRKQTNEKNVYKICGEFYSRVQHFLANVTGIMYGGCALSTRKLIRIIEKEKPDVVHLQCLNGYFVNIYQLVTWLKEHHIKTVLTLHAEFMYTANCGYALSCEKWTSGCGSCPRCKEETGSYILDRTATSWQKMKKAFDGFQDDLVIVSVSPWLMERATKSPILAGFDHRVIYNGLNTDVFRLYPQNDLRQKHGLKDEKVLFYVTPGFSTNPEHIKGGYYLLELAKRMRDANVKFIVAGPYPGDLEVPDNVIMLGKVLDQKLLAQYYAMADVTLLTSKKETFSMVCAESLCCGTPVVGFKAGAPEMITLPEYSAFVEYGDMEQLQREAECFMEKDFNRTDIAKQAHEKYSVKQMADAYLKIYQNM